MLIDTLKVLQQTLQDFESISNQFEMLSIPKKLKVIHIHTAWKVSKYGVISGPYFPVFGLNTDIYGVSLRIQSEYMKIHTKNNSVFGHFSRNGNFSAYASFSTYGVVMIKW